MSMTVGELRRLLAPYDDDVPVFTCVHRSRVDTRYADFRRSTAWKDTIRLHHRDSDSTVRAFCVGYWGPAWSEPDDE